jgi:hypothetical protein
MPNLVMITGYLVCGIVGLIGVAILWLIFNGTIDLSRLISEPTGDASMGRFQFLIFTFVISLSLFLIIVSGTGKSGDGKLAFPEVPGGILTLLGISGSSYAVGKAIQFSDPAGLEDRPVTVTISPSTATVQFGQPFQFRADVARKPDAKLRWELTAGRGAINPDTGLYQAPATPAPAPAGAAAAPAAREHATVKVTCVDYADVSDLAVVNLS